MCGCKINEESLKRKGEKIMKKMKKVFALLVAMVMVMGMTMTTMAAPKTDATITVKDENGDVLTGEKLELSYVQVIVADQTTRTGWAFTSDVVEKAYLDAFEETDDQVVIDQLIAYAAKAKNAATTEEIAKALSNVANSNNVAYETMNNPQTVDKAGVYAVKAVQEGYTYNNMAAYVGFTAEQGDYPSLTDVELTAKRTPVDVDKSVTDPDKVVAIGDIVTYTIETTVPYIDPNATNKTFKVWDKISGAEYYFEGEGSHFSIVMGDFDNVYGTEKIEKTSTEFTANLSDFILPDNANAGKKVLITYTAKVTAQTVENKVGSNISGKEVDSDNEKVYTGSITLTKYNEDKTEQLAGAGFEVRKDGSKEALKFTQLAEGHYEYNPNGEITEVFTGPDGTLIVKGLDLGTYNFKETTAPEGYHIKNDPSGVDATAILALKEGETEAKENVKIGTELTNTKLSSLPSTGGIGTTIFTIGGCVIMIAAAGLFFASRRKESK